MLLTGSGSAAIAVVRISGEGTRNFLEEHFHRKVLEGVCAYGRLTDGERVIDDAMVVRNGDSADLNVHGGIWIVQEILQLLERRGFQIVTWTPEQIWGSEGETEIEREINAALPLARTELAVRVLLNQREAWKEINSADAMEDVLSDRTLEWLLNPPCVAIVGLANVGKSTLANQLFGQERSITADVPGTTRDWVGEWANIDGLLVKLIDTPGQRETEDAIETRSIAAASSVIAGANLVVVVIDPTQDGESQRQLLAKWPGALVVVNKSDLGEWAGDGLHTIASRGVGIDQLRGEIQRHFQIFGLDESLPRCWTARQRFSLKNSLRGKSPANS